MRSTRRGLLWFGGTVAAAIVSGCVSPGRAFDEGTPTPRTAIEVRLLGPDVDRVLFGPAAVRRVGTVQSRNGHVSLRTTLSAEGAARVRDAFRSAEVAERAGAFEIVVVDRQRELARFGVSPALAEGVASGDWDGEFRMTFEQRSEADAVREALTCGAGTAAASCDSE